MGISEKQKKILAFSYTDYKALICDGAVRSGKTSIMTVAFVDWAMREFNNCTFVLAGKTVKSCQRNLVTPFMSLYETKRKYNVRFKITDNVMIVENSTTRNYFYIFGGKDESSYALIQGITANGILLDEVALMPRSFVEQAVARTLSVPTAKLWYNCNPDNPQHWFYKEWIQQAKDKNALHLHFLLEDNPIFTPEMIAETKKLYVGVFYDRYILGKWVTAEGAIYKIFSENKEKYYTNNPVFDIINIGVDFGGDKSKHSFSATGVTYNMDRLTVLKVKRVEAHGTTTNDLKAEFKKFYDEITSKYGYVQLVRCDSAQQTTINDLRDAFPHINFANAIKGPIMERVRKTLSLMGQGKFEMVRGQCEDLEQSFDMAVYDDKVLNEDKRKDKGDGSTFIDDLDSFEYSWEEYINAL